MADCNLAPLSPYVPTAEKPWNEQRVKHLYARIGYGITAAEIPDILSKNPVEYIESLVDEAFNLPVFPKPDWADWKPGQFNEEDGTEHYIIYTQFVTDWINEKLKRPLRDKIALFWSNVLVTKFEDYYYAPFLYQYVTNLQRNALGNYRTFIREMGLEHSMLIFLNGFQNNKWQPNENYARELFELFTLGLDNGYTENDIKETARAFTGYNGADLENYIIYFTPFTHDNGLKTIFGETANFDYNGVIDLLFEKKGELICRHVCGKIYRHFVNAEGNDNIIQQLADIMLANDFELLPVFKALFCSEHFFDATEFNTHIKSHIEYFTGILKQFNYTLNYEEGNAIIWYSSSLGQTYFDPVDVAGWKEDKSWIDSGSLLVRWLYSEWIYGTLIWQNQDFVISYLKNLTNNSNDVEFVVRTVVDQFFVSGLASQADYDRLLIAFKADLPENYYEQGLWNLDWEKDFICWQTNLLLNEMARLPDVTLC